MTDYDNAFSPDSPVGDDADPFAASTPVNEDPFAADSDPFAANPSGDAFDMPDDYSPDGDNQDAAPEGFGDFGNDEIAAAEEQKTDAHVMPESTVLANWQAERQATLRTKRDKAREEKEQQRETAKQTLADFHAKRKERLTKIRNTNRTEEKNFKQEMSQVQEFGSQWEKVAKLVNLQPKPNEKPGTSRVERMRSLLIQLKHESSRS